MFSFIYIFIHLFVYLFIYLLQLYFQDLRERKKQGPRFLPLKDILFSCIVSTQINSVLLARVVHEILRMQADKTPHLERVRQGVKACVVLFPLLGLTWVFGVLSVTDAGLVFQYIFTIFNSLQVQYQKIQHVNFLSSLRKQSTFRRGTQENIVQNHLHIALVDVFQYNLNGRYRLFFFICSDFLAESLVIQKFQRSKLTFSKILARKRLLKILGDLFRVEIR